MFLSIQYNPMQLCKILCLHNLQLMDEFSIYIASNPIFGICKGFPACYCVYERNLKQLIVSALHSAYTILPLILKLIHEMK